MQNTIANILEVTCSICHDSIVPIHSIGSCQNCHTFHLNCINKWLDIKEDCPNCRTKMFSKIPEALLLVVQAALASATQASFQVEEASTAIHTASILSSRALFQVEQASSTYISLVTEAEKLGDAKSYVADSLAAVARLTVVAQARSARSTALAANAQVLVSDASKKTTRSIALAAEAEALAPDAKTQLVARLAARLAVELAEVSSSNALCAEAQAIYASSLATTLLANASAHAAKSEALAKLIQLLQTIKQEHGIE